MMNSDMRRAPGGYLRVSEADDSVHDVELGDERVGIRVLLREEPSRTVQIPLASTVRALKQQIQTATGVLVARQRLVFGGKIMRPDDSTLSGLGLHDGSSVHLFPTQTPAAPAQPAAPTAPQERFALRDSAYRARAAGSAAASAADSDSSAAAEEATYRMQLLGLTMMVTELNQGATSASSPHAPPRILLNSDVIIQGAGVRLWCAILLIYATLCQVAALIFYVDNMLGARPLSRLFGDGVGEIMLHLADLGGGVAAMYVAKQGYRARSSCNLALVKVFLENMFVLALFSCAKEVLWVWLVHFEADEKVRSSRERYYNSNSGDDYVGSEPAPLPMDSSFVVSETVEASVWAVVIVLFWAQLYYRCREFKSSVVKAHEDFEASAAATTDGEAV